jgi:hypothetical protein
MGMGMVMMVMAAQVAGNFYVMEHEGLLWDIFRKMLKINNKVV